MTHSPALWLASTASNLDLDREAGVSFHASAEDAWRTLWADQFDGVTPEEILEIVASVGKTIPSPDAEDLSMADIAAVLEALPEFGSTVIAVPATSTNAHSQACIASVAA